MEDLTQKVESLFGVRKFSSNNEFNQNIQSPVNFVSDVIIELPKIINHFDQVARQLKSIIESSCCTGSTDESDLFTDDLFSDEANLTKICFGLCLRLLAALFTWPEFDNHEHENLLRGNNSFKH